ncbi:hypothetical protein KSF_076810 [Reticulibacter mediterranei]|uniref:Uncharacterized protein n=1 Tax=Reticulibacter mediterranei TaxID=2778369 RepID=A0A8J3IS59_9CHLR|nr:hypothetical protein KSF_076810 [Reticulibacter mediterranei]
MRERRDGSSRSKAARLLLECGGWREVGAAHLTPPSTLQQQRSAESAELSECRSTLGHSKKVRDDSWEKKAMELSLYFIFV